MRKIFFVLTAVLVLFSGRAWAGTVTDALDTIKVNGFSSFGYNFNFNEPDSGAINFRPFNDKHNSFTLEVAELVFQKEASEAWDVGFRTDLTYGFTIPEATRSTGLTLESDQFDLQQAYIRWVAPVGSGLTLDFGKFITEMGYEVIEGYDGWNYNYSRSLLFYFTIPFTHTGVRAAYEVNDQVMLVAALYNGWDSVVDNNDAKSVMLHAMVHLAEGTLVNLKYCGGAEQTDSDGNLRHVFNVNLTHELPSNITLALDLVYGTEDEASVVVAGDDATWTGLAGMLRYALNDTVALNFRAEFFNDEDGSRTGTAQDMWEVTITPEFTVGKNMVIRPEYRHDASDKDVFDKDGTLTDSQETLGLNVFLYF